MNSMVPRTWLLSGVPRSGTSLCCRLAGALPDTVALSEPIRRKAFGGMDTPCGACARIGDFAEQARARILAERRASSVQVDGRLDDNRSASRRTDAGLRRLRGERGEIAIDKPLSAHFTLLIKHNALFAALLPRLTKSFSCLALVRNPLLVLASWQTVDLPVHRGRIPAGEELDGDLHRALEREPEVLRRQLIVLDWFFGRFHAHLNPQDIIRYEDVVESGGGGAVPPAGARWCGACGTDEPQPQRSVRHSHDRCSSGGVAGQQRALDPVLLPRGLRTSSGPDPAWAIAPATLASPEWRHGRARAGQPCFAPDQKRLKGLLAQRTGLDTRSPTMDPLG